MSGIRYSPGVIRFIYDDGTVEDVTAVLPTVQTGDSFAVTTGVGLSTTPVGDGLAVSVKQVVGNTYIRPFEKLDDNLASATYSSEYNYSVTSSKALLPADFNASRAKGTLRGPHGMWWPPGLNLTDADFVKEGGTVAPPPRTYTINQPPAVAPSKPVIIRDLPSVTLAPLGSPITIAFDVSPCSIQWYEEGVGPIALALGKVLELSNMVAEDVGRRFYAICTGPSGQAVITSTTELALGAEGFDPYRDGYVKYQSTYDNWTRVGDYGAQYIPPADVAPVLATYTTVENYQNPTDSIQDWSARALQGEYLSRFGANSLRINGQASF